MRRKRWSSLKDGRRRTFVERLKQSGLADFLDLSVRNYGGRSNRKPNRIEMMLQEYKADGYTVYLQGDADGGRPEDTFSQLISRGLVDPPHTFVFKQDFESAVPPAVLHRALRSLNELEDVSESQFVATVEKTGGSVATMLGSIFGLDMEPLKVPLAQAVADYLNDMVLTGVLPSQSPELDQTELGQFLVFLSRVR